MRILLTSLLAPLAIFGAQADPLSAFNRIAFSQVKGWLLQSAEKMPEEAYAFRPTEAVRGFGQIIGHVADANYRFCSAALGEKNPALLIEKTKTTKADLLTALKEAFAYCDRAYAGSTDATGVELIKLSGMDMPRLSALQVNIAHTAEHYGNLATYMRLKNMVPPSSEPPARPQPKQ